MGIIRALAAIIAALFGLLIITPLILVGLVFWTVALLTRVTARVLEPRHTSWHHLIEYEPTVGWKPKANLDAHYLVDGDDVFHVITDSHGWAGKTSITDSDLIVFGDSFAFGFGINAGLSFAELNPNLRIKAIAANGYSMVHEVLWMERLSSQIAGKLVVWFIFIGNDLYENIRPNLLHYRMPFVRSNGGIDEWEIVTSHVSPARWPFPGERDYRRELAEICSPTFTAGQVYSACEFLIKRGHEICSQANAQLVIMTIPSRYQLSQQELEKLSSYLPEPRLLDPNLPDERLREICSRLGIPFISAKGSLRAHDYKSNDAHWNQKGHQRIAELLHTLSNDYRLRETRDKPSVTPRLI